MNIGACAICGTAGDRPTIGDPLERQLETDLVEMPGSLPARRLFLCRRCTKTSNALFAANRRRGWPGPPRRTS